MKYVKTYIMIMSVLILLACVYVFARPAAPVTEQQQADASVILGLTFPPQTRFLFYDRLKDRREVIPTPDDTLRVKIELPAAALVELLSQPPLSTVTWSHDEKTVSDDSRWPQWQTSGIKKFRATAFDPQLSAGVCIVIDDDRDDTKTVYILRSER